MDDGRVIFPPPRTRRLYPRDPNSEQPGRYLFLTRIAPARNTYAGFWDDVYLSQDQGHSFIHDRWQGRNGNRVQGIRQGMITLIGGDIHQIGANLTSQSTTMMGHDLVNNATRLFQTERRYYFADVLRAGPAHISYIEPLTGPTRDRYQALSPVVYNSIGSSGSETAALTKMVIAGGYLSRELKNQLKRNGLYPSTLLFLWKTALPYKVSFAHELRHRPAYVSLGDQAASKAVSRLQAQELAYFYDDTLHLRNMVETVRVELRAEDPEGFPVSFAQWAGEVGQIQDDVFTWRCPEDHPPGQESVTIIASDKSSGNCYAARRFLIRVKGEQP